jgi:uncharacterized membrane protein
MVLPLAFLIGIIAGLRTMTAPAAASWAAHMGLAPTGGTWLSFMNHAWVSWLMTILALAELVTDQLPSTPSRKVPPQFTARVLTGALSGAVLTIGRGGWVLGALLGAIGAVIGTLGGAAARARLAAAFGHDMPAALLEDAVAIGGAVAIISMLP